MTLPAESLRLDPFSKKIVFCGDELAMSADQIRALKICTDMSVVLRLYVNATELPLVGSSVSTSYVLIVHTSVRDVREHVT